MFSSDGVREKQVEGKGHGVERALGRPATTGSFFLSERCYSSVFSDARCRMSDTVGVEWCFFSVRFTLFAAYSIFAQIAESYRGSYFSSAFCSTALSAAWLVSLLVSPTRVRDDGCFEAWSVCAKTPRKVHHSSVSPRLSAACPLLLVSGVYG